MVPHQILDSFKRARKEKLLYEAYVYDEINPFKHVAIVVEVYEIIMLTVV